MGDRIEQLAKRLDAEGAAFRDAAWQADDIPEFANDMLDAAQALRELKWQNDRAFWVRPDGEYTTIPPEPPALHGDDHDQ